MAEVDLRGKTALITGAAKRIGRAIALALANQGVNIIIHYSRSQQEAEALRLEIEAKGQQAWTIQADFAKPDEYDTLIDRARQQAGEINILINNASIFPQDTMDSVTFDAVMTNVQINAWVPFVLSRAFVRQVTGGGKIINMLDSRLRGYDWNHVAYMWSKQVLELMTRMSALEFAPAVTVNAIAPGLILPPPGKDESYIDRLADTLPLKRHGDPEGIAQAAVYLLKTDFLTGEVIYVDGGRHLREYIGGSNPH